ncbi:hypothetical protein AAG906_027868 [Vitis piasezkii]
MVNDNTKGVGKHGNCKGLIDALQENVKRRKWSQKTPHFSPPSTPGSLLLISPPEAKSKYIKQQDSPHLWSVKSTENGLKGGPVAPMIREKINVGLAACIDQLQGLIDALQENVERRKWSQKTPHFSPPPTPGHCC